MSFEDQYKTDVANTLKDGMPAVMTVGYTNSTGDNITINALDVSGGSCNIRDEDTGEIISKRRDVVILCASGKGVSDPQVNDEVIIADEVWKVININGKDAAKVMLTLAWAKYTSKHNSNHKHKIFN